MLLATAHSLKFSFIPLPKRKFLSLEETPMSKLNYKDVAYYGRSIESLTKEELLEALLKLAMMVKDCPVKDGCMRVFDDSDIRKGKD